MMWLKKLVGIYYYDKGRKKWSKKGVVWNMFRCRFCSLVTIMYYVMYVYEITYARIIIITIITLSNFYSLRFSCINAAARRTQTFYYYWYYYYYYYFYQRLRWKSIARYNFMALSTEKKNGMYTRRVNKFKFSLASYSIIRNVLFEQSWHLLNRYFILYVQSKGSKLPCRTRSI